jgi:hypothetical protein
MAKPSHTGRCDFQPARRGDFEVCSHPDCNERFPCAGNDCGHLDCIDRREKAPKCHFCEASVAPGVRGVDWGTGNVHGQSRAYHYECRDEHANPADRVRTGASFNP